MENFTYCTPTRYVFGHGAENEVGMRAVEMGAHRVLVVYGGGSAVRSGLLARVEENLKKSDLYVTILGGVQPNPTDTLVYSGIEICREQEIHAIIAVGGGSVIDTAKAIAAGTLYDGDFWDFFCGKAVRTRLSPSAWCSPFRLQAAKGRATQLLPKPKAP